MRVWNLPPDDESSFQRTPSYRIATIYGNGTANGSVAGRDPIAKLGPPAPKYSAPLNFGIPNGTAAGVGERTWARSRSYSDITDSDLANVQWQTLPPVVSPTSVSPDWRASEDDGSRASTNGSVQRRGSYSDAVEGGETSLNRLTTSGKILHKLKLAKNAFLVSPDPQKSHEKDDRSQLVGEPDRTYARRWASLWLTWIIMFILILQFSMYSSTLGTYLRLIEPGSENFAPWAISAFGFGQTFACPVFGWWSNYIKNNRLPMAVGVLLMIVGNVGYCMVEMFPVDSRKWAIFFFRVIIGVGGGIAGVIRAYCATAAKPHEYTKAVTGATAGLSLAIMAGPGAQAIFAPIGYPGISLGIIRLHMYNAPAVASIFIGIVCIILLYTVLLQEYPGLAKDEKKDRFFVLPKYDVCATWVIIFCWFAAYLTLTSFVMIGKSYTMVMFHWSYVQAVVDNGIIMGVFAGISLAIFILYAYHGKKFDERFLMYLGITMMCAFFLVTFPWPGLTRLHQECGELPCCNPTLNERHITCVDLRSINKTNLMDVSHAIAEAAEHGPPPTDGHSGEVSRVTALPAPQTNHRFEKDTRIDHDDFPGGCQAVKFNWCDSTTREPMGLYMATFFLLAVGFPIANCAFSALFSKVIGPRRQGFMQGVIISGGAAARTSGPIFINYTFDWWGPRVSWGLTAGILVASIILSAVYYRRLIPLNPNPKLHPGEFFRYKKGVLYRF